MWTMTNYRKTLPGGVLVFAALTLARTAICQTTPQSLLVTRIDNIRDEGTLDCGPAAIDNRSQATRTNTTHTFSATAPGAGAGDWSVKLQYSPNSCTGPWVDFGAEATVDQTSSSGIGRGLGYAPFLKFVFSGSQSSKVRVQYYGVKDAPIPGFAGTVHFPISWIGQVSGKPFVDVRDFTSLALAAAATPAGGTLMIPSDYAEVLASPVVISRNITISGSGGSITGPANAAIFLGSGTVSAFRLTGLTLHCGSGTSSVVSIPAFNSGTRTSWEGRTSIDNNPLIDGCGAVAINIGQSAAFVTIEHNTFRRNCGSIDQGSNSDMLVADNFFIDRPAGCYDIRTIGGSATTIGPRNVFIPSALADTADMILYPSNNIFENGYTTIEDNKFGPERYSGAYPRILHSYPRDATIVSRAVRIRNNHFGGVATGHTATAIRLLNPIDRWQITQNEFLSYTTLVDDEQTQASGLGHSSFLDNLSRPVRSGPAPIVFTHGGAGFTEIRHPEPTAVPAWLTNLGDGSDGALLNANGPLTGDMYYTDFTIPYGSTVTVNNAYALTIHATGTCTIAGLINASGLVVASTYAIAGGAGGGSGGGRLVGTAGTNTGGAAANPVFAAGGGAGAISGGNGGNGSTSASSFVRAFINYGAGDGIGMSGGAGKAGANSGGASGVGGAGVTFICDRIAGTDGAHTGTIDTSGGYGGAAVGNNTGAGSGGGGAPIILSARTITNLPNLIFGGGRGGSCAVPMAQTYSRACTTEPVLTLGLTADAVNSCTIINAGAGCLVPPLVAVVGGGGTGALVHASIANGAVAACIVDAGGSGYTTATYTTCGTGGDGGAGWTAIYKGW